MDTNSEHSAKGDKTYQCLSCRMVFTPPKGAIDIKCPTCGGDTLQLLKVEEVVHEGKEGQKRLLKG